MINKVRSVLFVPDTWAIWNPVDLRTASSSGDCSVEKLKIWYGIKSSAWNELMGSKNLKPEIMLVGENPSKNNDKVIDDVNILIQCFHTSSLLDRSLKSAIEQVKFFEGAYMTDAFAWAYEENGKKIRLGEIKKRYPDYWRMIYEEAKTEFVNKINKGKGSLAIIALGNDAFRYIQEFLQLTTNINPRVKKFEVSSVRHNLRIYRVDHPSPLNARFRRLFIEQLEVIAEDLKKMRHET